MDRESFEEIPKIIESIMRVRDIDDISDLPIVIIETKCDLNDGKRKYSAVD
jgi:hypothetical protein